MDRGVEFQAYVRGCLDSLHNYAVLLARPPEDHEDLLQDALIRGFRGFDSFDRALPFKAWIPMDSPLYAIPLAPEDVLLRQETVEHVREAIRPGCRSSCERSWS